MIFQALTCAPMLREGITLNIMAVPQTGSQTPEPLSVGALVTLRFGNCCPLVRQGRIAAVDANGATLDFEGVEWVLVRSTTGIAISGIVSEDWIVTRRAE